MDLQLPPDIEATLRQQAAASGMDIEKFTLDALRATLSHTTDDGSAELSADEWRKELDQCVALHPSLPNVDDSREAIYSDRGQ